MKSSRSTINRFPEKNGGPITLGFTLLFLSLWLGGCIDLNGPVDKMINEIDKTRQTIQGESSGWRDELPKLVNDLNGIESQASGDVKGIVADTTNQVQDLATQTIQFSDAKAKDLIAQAGAEARCNADFIKSGAIAQLQYLVEDLKFWKNNKTHLSKKPIHAVCAINPSTLSLYPSGNNWLIDPSNLGEKNIVHVFGYNFWSDALPSLELQDGAGQTMRQVRLTAAYVTHYQINLDFSGETFPDVKLGARVVFLWPDQPDPNTINLTLNALSKLKIAYHAWRPGTPSMLKDPVVLQVTITNQGGSRSGNFVVTWKPDPNDPNVLNISPPKPLEAGVSVDLYFPGYVYKRAGSITSVVSLSTGDDTISFPVIISSNIKNIALDYSHSFPVKGGGGGGGGEMNLACQANYLVTGLLGRSGDRIDQIRLQCSLLNSNGTIGTPYLTNAQGGSGGTDFGLYCPPNQVVTRVIGLSGDRVNQLQGYCSTIMGPESFETGAAGRGGGTPFDAKCPPNFVVTSVSGRSGEEVDQVNIVCTEIVQK